MSKQREERLALGLCASCGNNPPLKGRKSCDDCRAKSKVNAERLYAKRLSAGLCKACGKNQIVPDRVMCQLCFDRIRKLRKPFVAGACRNCGRQFSGGGAQCALCNQKSTEHIKRRTKARIALGICYRCRGEIDNLTLQCTACLYKDMSGDHLGKSVRWKELKNLMDNQQGRCVYSGIPLKVGVNASVDHKLAKSKGGQNEIENLQWVHKWVNIMKSDMDDEQFRKDFRQFIEDASQNLIK